MKAIMSFIFRRNQPKIPLINHYPFYAEGIWKADLMKFNSNKRYEIIDFNFNEEVGGFIKYYYK